MQVLGRKRLSNVRRGGGAATRPRSSAARSLAARGSTTGAWMGQAMRGAGLGSTLLAVTFVLTTILGPSPAYAEPSFEPRPSPIQIDPACHSIGGVNAEVAAAVRVDALIHEGYPAAGPFFDDGRAALEKGELDRACQEYRRGRQSYYEIVEAGKRSLAAQVAGFPQVFLRIPTIVRVFKAESSLSAAAEQIESPAAFQESVLNAGLIVHAEIIPPLLPPSEEQIELAYGSEEAARRQVQALDLLAGAVNLDLAVKQRYQRAQTAIDSIAKSRLAVEAHVARWKSVLLWIEAIRGRLDSGDLAVANELAIARFNLGSAKSEIGDPVRFHSSMDRIDKNLVDLSRRLDAAHQLHGLQTAVLVGGIAALCAAGLAYGSRSVYLVWRPPVDSRGLSGLRPEQVRAMLAKGIFDRLRQQPYVRGERTVVVHIGNSAVLAREGEAEQLCEAVNRLWKNHFGRSPILRRIWLQETAPGLGRIAVAEVDHEIWFESAHSPSAPGSPGPISRVS